MDSQIRVMLVDAQKIVLYGLHRLIDDERPDLAVVGTASDCASAVDVAASAKPDVIVVDVGLATEKQAAVVPTLINGRNARVLILAGERDGDLHEVALLKGACGVVRKDDTPEVLIKAIKKVHEGQLWLDRSTTGRLFVELSRQKSAVPDPAKRKLASLTEREQDVVRSLVTQPGADNKTLATRLHIGEHTLRNHLSRIYDKLDVPNRLELYVFAQRHTFNGQTTL
jgi:DNA-binding NarL/FixJ family response regulator